MRVRTGWLAALFVVGVLGVVPARAQVSTGRIDVKVVDASEAVLPGVTVELSGPLAQTGVTDALGEAHFLNLPVGAYTVAMKMSGFADYQSPEIPVGAGAAVPLRVAMRLGGVTEQVEVTSAVLLIDTKRQSTGVALTNTELQEVPSSRDPLSVLQTVPSVVTDRVNVGGSESGGGTAYFGKGASSLENTVNLDGVTITDGGYGFSLGRPDFDSFQEVQVTTGGATTSNPTAGVQVNYVLKQGANDPHGSARVYFDNDSMQGNNVTEEYEAVIGRDEGNRIDQYADFGAELGGPIVRNKVWGWGTASRMDVRTLNISGYPGRTTSDMYAAKVVAQATPGIRPELSFYRSDSQQQAAPSPARPPETSLIVNAPVTLYKLQSSFVIGSKLFLSARVAQLEANQDYTPQAGIEPKTYLDAQGVWHNSFFYGRSKRPQTSVAADGNYFKGRHELKFGFAWRKTPIDSSSAISGADKIWALHLSSYATDRLMLGFVKRDWRSVTDGRFVNGYIGDTITFDRATLILALRYDYSSGSISETTVPGVPGEPLLPSVTAPAVPDALTYGVPSPRVGFSYAIDKSRKTLARVSYALLANQLKTRDVRMLSGITYAGVYYLAVDANRNGTAERSEFLGPPIGYYGFDPSNPSSAATSVNKIDPDIKSPRTHEIIFGLDRQLTTNLSINGSFSYRRFENMIWTPLIDVRADDYIRGPDVTGTLFGEPYSIPNYYLPGNKVPVGNGAERVTREGYHQTYMGLEVTATKRLANHWMARLGFSTNSHTEYFDDPISSIQDPTAAPNAPNMDGGPVVFAAAKGSVGTGTAYVIQPKYQFIANGLYEGPWGINLSANLVVRQGFAIPYYKSVIGAAAPGSFPPQKNVLITDAIDEYRLDTLSVLDGRISKKITFGKVNVALDLDVFNLMNAATVLARQPDQRFTGPTGFNSIQEILSPRIARVGLRVNF